MINHTANLPQIVKDVSSHTLPSATATSFPQFSKLCSALVMNSSSPFLAVSLEFSFSIIGDLLFPINLS